MKQWFLGLSVLVVFVIGCKANQTEAHGLDPTLSVAEVLPKASAEAPAERVAAGMSSEALATDPDTLDWTAFPLEGEVLHRLAWTDFRGQSGVVIAKQVLGQRGLALVAVHARLWADGTWSVVSETRDTVENCASDPIAEAFVGDWSIRDLDMDSVGEATFAWKLGCPSSSHPNLFKVSMIEDDQIYTLTGSINDKAGHQEPLPEAAFENAPRSFQPHAQKVWQKTTQVPEEH